MLGAQHLMTAGGEIMLACDSADFDGTNDNMKRGAALTGIANSKKGTLSFWLRLDAGDGVQMNPVSAAGLFFVCRRTITTNLIQITALNAASAGILQLDTVNTLVAGAAWRHVLASWDLATAGARHLYIDDVSDLAVTTFTDDTIAYASATNWGVGGATTDVLRVNGCLAEVFFKAGEYLDLGVVANRRRFRSSSGKPRHLGADGSLAGLGVPEIYLHLDDAEAVANFATNRGGGGNFTITGLLDTGSNSPSD